MTAALEPQPSNLIGADADERERYRRERATRLARENEHLRAERNRLERMLAVALRVAVGGTTCQPVHLLEAIAAYTGDELARPAFVVERERKDRTSIEGLVQLLRATDPERIVRSVPA